MSEEQKRIYTCPVKSLSYNSRAIYFCTGPFASLSGQLFPFRQFHLLPSRYGPKGPYGPKGIYWAF